MKKTKKQLISQQNKKEIFYNIINSLLFGGAFFVGSLLDGDITWKGALIAGIATAGMMIAKFKEYWDGEKSEYCKCLGNFISI